MARRPPKPAPVVVKRSAEERKKLPPELEAFARSDEEKLRLRRPRVDRGKVRDPREGYIVAGVANRDARTMYDMRVAAMRELWAEGAAESEALAELGEMLLDAQRLTLWRAKRVISFDVLAEDVLQMPAKRARELAAEAAERTGETAEPLDERTVAVWMRSEAGLCEGDERARVRLRGLGEARRLEFTVLMSKASLALAGAGARHAPLAREQLDRALSRADREVPESPVRARVQAPRVEEAEDEAAEAEAVEDAGEPAPAAARGGARLLTRRRAPEAEAEAEDAAGDAGDGEAAEAPPPRPARRVGERAERASFERPARRFEGDRPRKFEGGDRPRKFEGGDRPRKFEGGDRPRKFEGGDRPRKFEGGDRPRKFTGERSRNFGEGAARRFEGDRPRKFSDRPREGGRKFEGARARGEGTGARGARTGGKFAGKQGGFDRGGKGGFDRGGKGGFDRGGKGGFDRGGKGGFARGGKGGFDRGGKSSGGFVRDGGSFGGGGKSGGFKKGGKGFGEKRTFDKPKNTDAKKKRDSEPSDE